VCVRACVHRVVSFVSDRFNSTEHSNEIYAVLNIRGVRCKKKLSAPIQPIYLYISLYLYNKPHSSVRIERFPWGKKLIQICDVIRFGESLKQ